MEKLKDAKWQIATNATVGPQKLSMSFCAKGKSITINDEEGRFQGIQDIAVGDEAPWGLFWGDNMYPDYFSTIVDEILAEILKRYGCKNAKVSPEDKEVFKRHLNNVVWSEK